MKQALLFFICILFYAAQSLAQSTPVFINEIHYDNTGADQDEGIEIAGPAGTDLNGWAVKLYNGSNGSIYGAISLSGTIPDQDNGFGALWFSEAGIQNGAPDGFALIDDSSSVIQFLSYEGSFMAAEGPANSSFSQDIGVSQSGTTPLGSSLQLTGIGKYYEDFTWQAPATSTTNAFNNNQSFIESMNTLVKFSSEIDTVSESGSTYYLSLEILYPDSSQATSCTVVLTQGNSTDIGGFDSTIVTFPAGSSSNRTVTIPITDDQIVEGTEGLIFTVQNVQGGNSASASTPNTFTLLINDNDQAPDIPNIIITEIMQNPDSTSDSNGEWLELYNATNNSVDINGWTIKDNGSNSHTITNGGPLTIAPYGYMILGIKKDTSINGNVAVDYQYNSFSLGNSDDEVILTLNNGTTVDSVAYDGGPNWPDPTGASMVFTGNASDDNSDYNFWSTSLLAWPGSAGDFGSPGSQYVKFSVVTPDSTAPGDTTDYGEDILAPGVPFFSLASEISDTASIQSFSIFGNRNPNLPPTDKAIDSYVHITGEPDSCTIKMYYTDEQFVASGLTDENELRIASWNGFVWTTYPRGAGSNIDSNVVTAENIISFSEWVIIGSEGESPLPVALTVFSGRANASGVQLNWITASETDNAGFILLRNGVEVASYTNTDALNGQGTTSSSTVYSYLDNVVELGFYTYAIQSVDISGQIHDYSLKATVEVTKLESGATIEYTYVLDQNYPNPFNPTTNIAFEMKKAGMATIKVYDVLGRAVQQLSIDAQKGNNVINFNGSNLSSGMYFYQMTAEGFTSQMKRMILVK